MAAMTIALRLRQRANQFLRRLLCTSLVVYGLGMASTPAIAAGTSIAVDSQPLIIQKPLAPNIVLMLDDSGSMAWDVMPDYGYLSSTTADALVSASVNGLYYNPAVTYAPPPLADQTSGDNTYPNASFTSAWVDGFNPSSGTLVNLSRYDGKQDSSQSGLTSNLVYSKSFSTVSTTYAPTLACASGDTGPLASGTNIGKCQKAGTTTYYAPNTPKCDIGHTYNATTKLCVQSPISFFSYTVKTSSGYTRYYVASHSGDCAAAALSSTVCSESAADQQNVANWFSYYHTRILMAKSGLMSAFSGVDATYRIGFGSINNRNIADIQATGQFTSSYNSKTIAMVQPFGDGSSGSQKAYFWNWVTNITPGNSTPLRVALDAVGQYYQSDQPWRTDPASSSSGELACRASYTILTTDGFWNESFSGAGEVDGVAGPTLTGPNGQSFTYTPALPFADTGQVPVYKTSSYPANLVCSSGWTLQNDNLCHRTGRTPANPTLSCTGTDTLTGQTCMSKVLVTAGVSYPDTLADVAMKYWVNDLRPNTKNEVPTSTEDPAFWQHMATFTLGLGFTPVNHQVKNGVTTDPPLPISQIFDWAHGNNSKAISGFQWPQPSADNLNNIADLAHAAVNGHGGFYSATSPEAFSNGLKDALKRASERVGTGASLAANSTQLQTGTVAYQANYYTAKWKGDLKALAIDSSTGAIATNPSWVASAQMPTAVNRNIYTYNPSTGTYVELKVASGTLPALSSAQLARLGVNATAQANMINYLRGDSANEVTNGGSYRNRDTAIGDIVNSQPVYVGAPSANQFNNQSFTGSTAFAQYASDNAKRTDLIFVASNDGMLHGFNADTGTEAYAYLPGAVITEGSSKGIVDLASTDYGMTAATPHQFFNDGELTVGDVYDSANNKWKTILVGTTGRGLAKAVYALDVTSPGSIKFLWERSSNDGNAADGNSKYIGQMTGKPVIAQTSDGGWSVLIGNGYNSPAGVSALLQFKLSDGSMTVHVTSDTTGLAAPAVWIDPANNGISTIAYAGDANGNVWSFTINTVTTDPTTGLPTLTPTPSSAGIKLFTAMSGTKVQPITAGMLMGKNSQTGDVWVFFGTGKYLTTDDLSDKSTQTWYGLIVKSGGASKAIGSQANKDRSSLVQRHITSETTAAANAHASRTVTTTTEAASMTNLSGWYMDLLQPSVGANGTAYTAQGERMVTPNQFQGSLLLGTTRIPTATDLCNPSGSGWVMALDPFTGTNPQSNFFDVNGDGVINANDNVNGKPSAGINFTSLPNNPIFVGGSMLMSFDNGSTSSIKTSGSGGSTQRVSWRELIKM